jgi:hypothetical protein
MKNIHVLPTDKPSKLFYNVGGALLFTDYENYNGVNIYITSDEEIKEGDWMIRGNEQPTLVTPNFFWDFGVRYYKIILTTDKDLIIDGVQAIDDDFLEWFVKNPSCVEVEVKKKYTHHYKTGEKMLSLSPVPDFSSRNMQCEKVEIIYKIIIPQEEPNPFELPKALPDDVFFKSLEEPKQETLTYSEAAKKEERIFNSNILIKETLEEVAENEASIFYEKGTIEWNKYRQVFELGAKWQAERMYSEEEVKDLILKFNNDKPGIYDASEWFEQYKKK